MATQSRIFRQLFIVGCARSGTTLLQAMLAGHPRVFTLPETHFFWRAQRSPARRRLGIASALAARTLRRTVDDLERPDLTRLIPRWSPFLRAYARAFCAILDRVAADAGKDVWVEKTPLHIRRLATISHYVENAFFVHVVRDGRDVVASLYEAASRDPSVWGHPTIERYTARWNQDVRLTLEHLHLPPHHLVLYDRLVADPRTELRALSLFLGIDFDDAMLEHRAGADRVLGRLAAQPWMQGVREPLRDTRQQKFQTIFSPSQQREIEERLMYGGDVGAAGVLPHETLRVQPSRAPDL